MSNKIDENSHANSVMEFWKSGIPLDRAVDVFGTAKSLSKIKRKARANALQIAEMGKANSRRAGLDADELFDALGALQVSIAEQSGIRSAKEEKLFERLISGELIAYGFPVHENDANAPQPVPRFLLHKDFVKWRARSFAGHNRHFSEVTISPAKVGPEVCRAVDPVSELKRRGPKPIGPLVERAIAYLRLHDPLFDDRSQEKRINEIRTEVARQNPARFPNSSRPGHTTVWNYLTGRRPLS